MGSFSGECDGGAILGQTVDTPTMSQERRCPHSLIQNIKWSTFRSDARNSDLKKEFRNSFNPPPPHPFLQMGKLRPGQVKFITQKGSQSFPQKSWYFKVAKS